MDTNQISAVMYLPLAAASIELEHVIVDGSVDRAVLATCSEPQRSAIIRAVNCHDDMLAALKKAHQFIKNGIEFGYIRMPDASTPDSAHDTPPMISAAIAKAEGK